MRRTKIIATLSPRTSYGDLKRMAEIFDCARINCSHGTSAEYRAIVLQIRQIEKELNRPIPVLFDLAGPKIRVDGIAADRIVSKSDEIVLNRKQYSKKNGAGLYLNFPSALKNVRKGDRIFIDDGKLRFKVVEVSEAGCRIEAQNDGVIRPKKGVNFPDTELALPSMTAKDIADIAAIAAIGADFIALSFVRKRADILCLRKELARRRLDIPVIAKMERPEVMRNLADVIDASDGVMVARGDLGVELSLEKVPVCQKRIVAMCRNKGRHVTVATQILETMIDRPEPTRAEVSDIANAIADGCDALMLSGETAYGRYPVEALKMLDSVARETERHLEDTSFASQREFGFLKGDITSTIAFAAFGASVSLDAKKIVCLTAGGQTAAVLSKFRSKKPVIAASYDERTLRRTALYFGVRPLRVGKAQSADGMMLEMERALLAAGSKTGETVIMTIGLPVAEAGNTNMIKVHRLGSYLPRRRSGGLPKKRGNV